MEAKFDDTGGEPRLSWLLNDLGCGDEGIPGSSASFVFQEAPPKRLGDSIPDWVKEGPKNAQKEAKPGEKTTRRFEMGWRPCNFCPNKSISVLLKFFDLLPIIEGMPNLYFCQPHAKNQGMLRAVLSVNECERVVSKHAVTFFGESFPSLSDGNNGGSDFAVLRFAANETTGQWRPGFYRLELDLVVLNDMLRDLQR
jgi:hypothetical protein